MLRLLALFLMGMAFALPARAQGVRPWTEAVVSVRDLDATARLFREIGAWRETHRGRLDPAEIAYWRLPSTAKGAFLRLCAPKAAAGCLRLVRFDGVAQRPIRLAARPWDTGGIFSLMARTDDVQAAFDRAIALGWWAESEPIAFSFGGSNLRNVVLTGPHGINLALYERARPAFTAFPVGRISQFFNSMRMVRDQKTALAFYREKLGFGLLFDADYLDPQPQPSNFSVPHNLTTQIPRRAGAAQPMPGETGRVELMQFVGFTGKDVSAHAIAPNLGILSVRYPVDDLAAYRATLAQRGVSVVQEARDIHVPGLGRVQLFAIRDPDGNLTEFYQVPRSAGPRGHGNWTLRK